MTDPPKSESSSPSTRRPRRWRLATGIIGLLILTLSIHLIWRWHSVARLQHAALRNYEIDFNSARRPDTMPAFADAFADWVIEELDKQGRLTPANNRTALGTRVHSLFRGPIRSIEIVYPEDLTPEFASALRHFPQLEYLLIDEPGVQWESGSAFGHEFIKSLWHLDHLKNLNLSACRLDEAQLEAIADLPALETLEMEKNRLPANFIEILAQSSSLKKLVAERILIEPPLDALPEKVSQGGKDPFASSTQTPSAPPDPFASGSSAATTPPDPFATRSREWTPSEAEKRLLEEAGIELEP